jgi:hypothetical protein
MELFASLFCVCVCVCVCVLAVRKELLGASAIWHSQLKGPKQKIRGRKLRYGVSWQGGRLKHKKEVKQGS